MDDARVESNKMEQRGTVHCWAQVYTDHGSESAKKNL